MTELIRTPFDAETTAAEAIAGIDLTGRRAIVTGGSSGIGVETARALAGAGAEVTLAVRDPGAGRRVAADIAAADGGRAVRVAPLDLADQASVAAFAAAWTGPLDLLINNAGVMAPPELRRTPEGWELQFATNHLGHFALAVGLHEALAAAPEGARIVSLSSRGHLVAPVDFSDLDFVTRPYDPWVAYGQSKTANVLFAVEAHRRWSGEGITANAVHPGAIMDTNLSRHMDPAALEQARTMYTVKSVEQGAATTIVVATSPLLDGVGGRYFEDGNEAPVLAPDALADASHGVAPYALDPEAAARLWAVSAERTA